jgi:hypothetical protein
MLRRQCALAVSRRVIVALTGIAFAILVSVAATHLHIGPDADEGCAVCAAVVGKLEGPTPPPMAVCPTSDVSTLEQFQVAQQVACAILVVLPPSCGPPHVA